MRLGKVAVLPTPGNVNRPAVHSPGGPEPAWEQPWGAVSVPWGPRNTAPPQLCTLTSTFRGSATPEGVWPGLEVAPLWRGHQASALGGLLANSSTLLSLH